MGSAILLKWNLSSLRVELKVFHRTFLVWIYSGTSNDILLKYIQFSNYKDSNDAFMLKINFIINIGKWFSYFKLEYINLILIIIYFFNLNYKEIKIKFELTNN